MCCTTQEAGGHPIGMTVLATSVEAGASMPTARGPGVPAQMCPHTWRRRSFGGTMQTQKVRVQTTTDLAAKVKSLQATQASSAEKQQLQVHFERGGQP